MTRILLCGLCPLPFENTLKSFGPGIRTWQFAHSLARSGHQVHLLAMQISGAYLENEAVRKEEREGVEIERLRDAEFFAPETLRARYESIRPDAVVGATVYGSHVLGRMLTGEGAPTVPFWADQFGHVMAEAQAKARLEGADWPLPHFWNLLQPILGTADKLSVVSRRQRYAAIGELGQVGRLSAETCGYDFTAVIPCALVPPGPSRREGAPHRPILRGTAYPEDAFVVLWSGGYNVWSDIATLFDGLERAMARDPRICFVSTGGEISGHDETTYRDFETRVAASPHRDRYYLQGWVRAELVPAYQAEADLGALTEIPIYEGLLGSKNRIVQWMGGGLPVAYNRVGDLGELLTSRQLGLTFETGDAERLSEQILWAADHPKELRKLAARAREYTVRELSFEATTRELVAWAEKPEPAPDVDLRRAIRSPADFAPSKDEGEGAANETTSETTANEIASPPPVTPQPTVTRLPLWTRIGAWLTGRRSR